MKTVDFNKLPRAHKRVLIAKDVIAQLKAQKLIANRGDYIDKYKIYDSIGYSDDIDIKSNYKKINKCHVCALGACLLSATKFGNNLIIGDLNTALWQENTKVDKLLASVFSKKQMLMIEFAFEGNSHGSKYAHDILDEKLSDSEEEDCLEFHRNIKGNSNIVLIAIMKNIIKNEGTFKP